MSTDVVQNANLAMVVMDHNNPVVPDRDGQVITRRRNLGGMGNEHPLAIPDPAHIATVDLGVVIELARQGVCGPPLSQTLIDVVHVPIIPDCHVPLPCAVAMCRCHVPLPCAVAMCRCHVPLPCAVAMLRLPGSRCVADQG
jgi:hypothetical protein